MVAAITTEVIFISILLKESGIVFLEFSENFFHYGFAQEGGLALYSEFLAIQIYGSDFLIVQAQYLTVLAQKRFFLLFQILGVNLRAGF